MVEVYGTSRFVVRERKMSKVMRVVLDPPLNVPGITKENHGLVDLDGEFDSKECYEWFLSFVQDRLIMAEPWEIENE